MSVIGAEAGASMSAMVARGGIDLGGTKIQAVLVDGKWNVLGSSRRPTPTTGGPGDVAEQMAETLREAALEAGMAPSELTGGGVGSPGNVNESRTRRPTIVVTTTFGDINETQANDRHE